MLWCLGSVMGWPQQAAEPHAASPLCGMWERISRVKAGKLGVRDSSMIKGRSKSQIEIKKNKTCKSYQLTRVQPVPKQLQPLQNSLPVLLLSVTVYNREYPFCQLGSAVPTALPPTPGLLAVVAEWEREKALMLCEHSSAVKHGCVLLTLLWSPVQSTAPYGLLER